MIKFLAGFLSALAVIGLGGYAFLIFGGVPLETRHPPFPGEEWLAHKAMAAHLKGSDMVKPPISQSEFNLTEGAKVYAQHCAVCHGGRTGGLPIFARGMFPPPPQLLKEGSWEVGYPPGSVHKLIHGGIRLTGMPAFAGSLSEAELWQVTLMLVNADKLPLGALEALASQ